MANKRAVLPGLGIKIVPFLLRLFPRSFILGGGRPFSAAQALKRSRALSRSGPRFASNISSPLNSPEIKTT